MEEILKYHFEFQKSNVLERISADLNDNALEAIIFEDLFFFNIKNQRNKRFLEFYLKTINNEKFFLNTEGFFRQFKTHYSLQGIDNYFLDNMETQKDEILCMIRENQLGKLFFEKFYQVKLKYRDGYKPKDLGSFFTKLVHTFRPEEYCALDNPVKSYFRLNRESFFIAFFIVSSAYRQWALENQPIIRLLKERFFPLASSYNFDLEYITDNKLLDMIFWSKGNQEEKSKKK